MQRKDGYIVRLKIHDESGRVVGEVEAISYKGLLALAHEDGLKSVSTKLLQKPSAENGNLAIVAAKVRTGKGRFAGIGDASPANVNRRIAPHIIRMAETRSIARALRIAVNVGEVALEELGEDVSMSEVASPRPAAEPSPDRTKRNGGNGSGGGNGEAPIERSRGRDDNPTEAAPGDRRAMSDVQRKLLFRLAYELGATREQAADVVLDVLGVDRFEHATRAEASRAIDVLKQRAEARKGNGKSHASEADHGPS